MKINPVKLFISIFVLFCLNIFAQVDVPRQTLAITYPQDEVVEVKFKGTTRFPRLSGSAKVKRTKRNGTEIDLAVDKMPRPFELGAGYATYVVWAISPDGQVDNLGEIKRRGFLWFDSKISVTTPLQNFALIITAEPHFLVKRPSKAIMLENLNPVTPAGKVVATSRTIQYFGNSSDYFNDPRTPEIAEADYAKTPSTILQARQAIALAKYAGAERDAQQELQSATTLLQNSENEWAAKRAEEEVDISARQAISAAVKAEDTARIHKDAREKRNEKTMQDAELQKAEFKYEDALQQVENLKFELAREQRSRELVERDLQNATKQIKDLREDNNRLKDEADKAKQEAYDAKLQLAKIQGEKETIEKQKLEQEKISRFQANIPILMDSLKPFGTVKQTERGIVLTLAENYWTGPRVSSFAKTTEPKLTNIANILLSATDYKFAIESHTDDKGTQGDLNTLTQERAQAIADKLMSLGIEENRIQSRGFGASMPIAPNTTPVNRAKNRRVDLILMPNVN